MKQKCSNLSFCEPDDIGLYANLSTEAPDQDIYIATDFGVPNDPPLDTNWLTHGGIGVATCVTSQTCANNIAANNQLTSLAGYNPASGVSRIATTHAAAPGASNSGGANGNGRPSGVGQTGQPTLYSNNEQQVHKKTPGGCDVNITVPAGTVQATSLIMANRIAQSQAQNTANQQPGLTISNCSSVTRAKCQKPYDFQFKASGGTAPYTFTADSLPSGLTMDDSGHITGTPLGPPSAQYINLTVTDSGVDADGNPAEITCKLQCVIAVDGPCIYPCPNLTGMECTPFSCQMSSLPQNCSWMAGGLPKGVTMSQQGLLSTTCLPGSFDFSVICSDPNATNPNGQNATGTFHVKADKNSTNPFHNGIQDASSVTDLQWFGGADPGSDGPWKHNANGGNVTIHAVGGCQPAVPPDPPHGILVDFGQLEGYITQCACKGTYDIIVSLQWDWSGDLCPDGSGSKGWLAVQVAGNTVYFEPNIQSGGGIGALFHNTALPAAFSIYVRAGAYGRGTLDVNLTLTEVGTP